MAIADVTVIPVGTEGPSVSEYVADIHRILEKYSEKGVIRFQLTPMNTIIEGDLANLFEVIQEIHESPFSKGISRVATSIRIDDRRDKQSTMEGKLKAVEARLGTKGAL
ncbi:hypothetical protein CVD28_23240 [Bacillus sp. M6-12]|uniref:MTH1187 family thiamine-binding protein n=1 Tax=Bacillus sp. M6-12 TaxID=2054166 RepID=UPI000C779FE9|nr:MTH1187 family thiamine-binding protein [Bacillus sp. M6-12]PLS15246.1 hypothetical protein CVD28_23240 [Bacillus sp. M6-12]